MGAKQLTNCKPHWHTAGAGSQGDMHGTECVAMTQIWQVTVHAAFTVLKEQTRDL